MPAGAGELRIVVPGYVDPSNSVYWESVIQSGPQVRDVIVNPASGPGAAVSEPYFRLIGALRDAGVRVLGYVSSGHGDRDPAMVTEEIGRWRAWCGVENVFLDEAAAVADQVPTYAGYAATVHEAGGIVVLNPGVIPERSYFEFADAIITFEDPVDSYLKPREHPGWLSTQTHAEVWHIVIGAPQNRLDDVVDRARQLGADEIYITDDVEPNPYDSLPPYWSAKLDAVGQ
ncbi:spherulation-specific family 4 protein [Arthrobacter pascens]|uniref:spherulation-specific family 4 protein n=1 Tax=Arthrobacter pascens TaxID=1677 RepID=UPI0027D8D1B6|nr:spherulation-specific family 4 protein [Arthrobacter pascens]